MRRRPFGIRELVCIGIFAALWGAVEMSVGAALHVASVPFRGLMLTGAGIAIALPVRWFVPRRGSVLLAGSVTALLKLISVGGTVLTPAVAILIESALAETVLSIGRPRRLSFAAAGGVAALWPLVHPFLTVGILAGRGLPSVYAATIQTGARVFGLSPAALLGIAGVLVTLHAGVGVIAGLIAWEVGRAVSARLRQDGSVQSA